MSAFIEALLNGGAERTTAQARQLALRRFSAWLADEGEIDELLTLKPVKTDTKVTAELSDDECSALIKACQGPDFRDRRDEAIVRLMIETGARAGEMADLGMADIDLRNQVALCRRADLAGIKDFHPHVLRHTAAARWLAAGGSEQGLMCVAGWRNRSMLDRYTANNSEKRAADEARRLGLGDL